MRNEHIIPGTEVPEDIRLQVYHEALEFYKKGEMGYGMSRSAGLCLLLACILWDLEDYCDNAPNKDHWDYSQVPEVMFPEFTNEHVKSLEYIGDEKVKLVYRIEILEDIIADM